MLKSYVHGVDEKYWSKLAANVELLLKILNEK